MAEAEAWVMIPKLDKDRTGCVLEMRRLVFCKNCKHYNKESGRCAKDHVHGYAGTWFCADGEEEW